MTDTVLLAIMRRRQMIDACRIYQGAAVPTPLIRMGTPVWDGRFDWHRFDASDALAYALFGDRGRSGPAVYYSTPTLDSGWVRRLWEAAL